MKVWDCFAFFNELELLELRLNELWDVVDYFVIIEANKTFQGDSKPYNLHENRHLFKKYSSKIIYLAYNWQWPKGMWAEHMQKNALVDGLKNTVGDDLIIFSDIDEIPRATIVEKLKEDFSRDENKNRMVTLSGPMYCYKLNGRRINSELGQPKIWYGPIAFTKDFFDRSGNSFVGLRKLREKNNWKLTNATWHFSYIGDTPDRILYKFQSWGHARDDFVLDFLGRNNSQEDKRAAIQTAINDGKYYTKGDLVEYEILDNTYPKYLLDNRDKFEHIIYKTT